MSAAVVFGILSSYAAATSFALVAILIAVLRDSHRRHVAWVRAVAAAAVVADSAELPACPDYPDDLNAYWQSTNSDL